MRILWLIGALALGVLAWSGWWWLGATAQKEAVLDWLADRRAAGWAAEAEVTVTGYPNRFDMIAEGLVLADPEAGWAWSAPSFRTHMLAYQPNEVIAAWPGLHEVSVPGERVTVSADRLRASAVFAPDTGLALRRGVLEAEAMSLDSELGWSAGLEDGQLSLRLSEVERGRDNAYDAVLELNGFRPPETARELFGPQLAGGLPERMEIVRLDATAAFQAPLDRRAVELGRMRPETVWLRPSELRWGDLRLSAHGRLEVDDQGVPEGVIRLEAREWRKLLAAAEAAGAIPPDLVSALETGLGLLSSLTSDGRSLEAPLRFSGGMMFLGPIPLGDSFRF
ncbi:MAG: DUF2125 domain-containing protein [Pseudomonadota bacterium]